MGFCTDFYKVLQVKRILQEKRILQVKHILQENVKLLHMCKDNDDK